MTQANTFFDMSNNPFMDPKNNPFNDKNLQNMFSNYEIPGFDIDGMIATQRKNFEAITAANKSAAEGMQSVFTKQTNILKNLMDEATASIQEISKAGAPEEQITKQVELTKVKLEAAVGNIRELSELAAKSQTEAFDILNARFTKSVEEIQALNKSTKVKPAAKK